MQDQIARSRERYDKLVAYLVQSSEAMEENVRALKASPLHPMHKSQLLSDSLTSARALLKEVLNHCIYTRLYLLLVHLMMKLR
jgi:hypothetical protein